MTAPLIAAVRRLVILGRPHWRLLGQAMGCMLVVGLTTGAYAFLMGPALRFLLTGGTQGLELVARVLPSATTWSRTTLLWAFPAVIIVIGGLKGVGYLGQFYFVGLFGQLVVVDLRRAVFTKLLGLSPSQLSTRLSGDLLSRFTADVAAVEQAATFTVASWLRDSLQILILVLVAFTLSWKLALGALVAVPLAVWPASRLTQALLRRIREGQASLGALAGLVKEGLGALRTLQAFNAEAAEAQRFSRYTASVERAMTRAGWARAGVPGVMEILASTAIAGTLAWAAASQSVHPEALVSFVGTVILLYQPAKDLGRVSQFAVTAAASLERLQELLDLEPAVGDAPTARDLAPLRAGITVSDLHFSWGERRALDGVSLEIPVGQVTALVGESGSGKSTLTSLLLRFERASSGRLTFDGVDVEQVTVASVRRQVALVTQEPMLFAASVRENLLVACPDANQEQVVRAATIAQAHGFIEALPHGYDTLVGERGVSLSGGQKQRLCLARAILSEAPVLVLDEASSNLDTEGERELLRAMDAALVGRTALVVAHRLNTVRGAHRIVVLDRGRVAELGTHGELLARGGVYAALWRRQQAAP